MNFTLERLSELTGLKVGTLQQHVRNGWLPVSKVPGRRGYVVTPAAARKWAHDRGYSLESTKV